MGMFQDLFNVLTVVSLGVCIIYFVGFYASVNGMPSELIFLQFLFIGVSQVTLFSYFVGSFFVTIFLFYAGHLTKEGASIHIG